MQISFAENGVNATKICGKRSPFDLLTWFSQDNVYKDSEYEKRISGKQLLQRKFGVVQRYG